MIRPPRRRSALLALALLVLLYAAGPGVLVTAVPGGSLLGALAGLLVVPGLALLFALVQTAERPYRAAYLVGVLHFWAFSASLRFVSLPGLLGIGLVGGLYFALIALWTRGFGRLGCPALGFALGVAATAWIRSHIPEIPYPHNQPIHALYQAPWLLEPLRLGGEVLGNLLVALLAAGLAGLRPGASRRTWRPVLGALAVWATAILLGAGSGSSTAGARLRVALVEPGLPSTTELQEIVAAGQDVSRLAPLQQIQLAFQLDEPLLRAALETERLIAAAGDQPPQLIVWPESSLPGALRRDAEDPDRARPDRLLAGALRSLAAQTLSGLPASARLLAGTVLIDADERRRGVVAAFTPSGELVGWHEKQRPVPAGERMPFIDLVPRAWLQAAVERTGMILRYLPDMRPGAVRAPLPIPGVPGGVAGLLCFDNAFEGVASGYVAAGARLLVVASNEAWYLQGLELEHMIAMSACRAVENRVPVVRSTIDGTSAVLAADGRLLQRTAAVGATGPRSLSATLDLPPADPAPRFLHVLLAWVNVLSVGVAIVVLRRRRAGRSRVMGVADDPGASAAR